MRPGGYHPRPNTAPSGGHGNGADSGYGNNSTTAPPYRPPAQQMTPQQREEVLMAAGRLAAEYLVSRGELPPQVLQNRSPQPRPYQERPHALQQHDQPLAPRPFQERPLARQHFQFRPGSGPFQRPFAPRPFQNRPIAKRPRPPAPRQFQGRPPALHPRAPAPRPSQMRPPFPSAAARGAAPPETGCPGQSAAPAGSAMQGDIDDAPAGDGSDRQPVPQSAGTAESPQTMDQPNQSYRGL